MKCGRRFFFTRFFFLISSTLAFAFFCSTPTFNDMTSTKRRPSPAPAAALALLLLTLLALGASVLAQTNQNSQGTGHSRRSSDPIAEDARRQAMAAASPPPPPVPKREWAPVENTAAAGADASPQQQRLEQQLVGQVCRLSGERKFFSLFYIARDSWAEARGQNSRKSTKPSRLSLSLTETLFFSLSRTQKTDHLPREPAPEKPEEPAKAAPNPQAAPEAPAAAASAAGERRRRSCCCSRRRRRRRPGRSSAPRPGTSTPSAGASPSSVGFNNRGRPRSIS